MTQDNLVKFKTPETPENFSDALSALIRSGAQQIIAQAVEAELNELLQEHQGLRDDTGRQAVVRNGYLPARTITTGVGEVEVQVPKVRDRTGRGIKFNSSLLPPYLKRSRSVEEVLPWLYLKGVSTGDFAEALSALLGPEAKGLSAATISRLKAKWQEEHSVWQTRSMRHKRYVYVWADGIYFNIRDDERQCLLVMIGVTDTGHKELLGMEAGYRESGTWPVRRSVAREGQIKSSPKTIRRDRGAKLAGAAVSERVDYRVCVGVRGCEVCRRFLEERLCRRGLDWGPHGP